MVVLLQFLANCHVYVPLEICFNKRRDFVYLNLLKVHQAYINISKINNKVFTTIVDKQILYNYNTFYFTNIHLPEKKEI